MEAAGFAKESFDGIADVYVLNTCSVTDNADKECRQIVRRIQARAPGSMVVVTGCYAQLKPAQIAEIPGVDLVLGAAEKFNLPQHLQSLVKGDATRISSCDIDTVTGFVPSWSHGDRTRSFLKVQDGCDYSCSFCTIPQARGKSRSDTVANALANAEALGSQGVKEIVLTGVNLGDFGKGGVEEKTFFDLVQALDSATSVPRYRISSIEPNLLSSEIIDFVGGSQRFMPHFHIPLQSGSNATLARMRRRYRRELYAERVEHIKALMPHCSIGVDVIVGFPGETEAEFEETYVFLRSLPVSYLHVFTYSERDNTAALSIPGVVPKSIRQERNKTLRNLSYVKAQQFRAAHLHQRRAVLFEEEVKNATIEGYTDNYIRVAAANTSLAGQIVDWEIA